MNPSNNPDSPDSASQLGGNEPSVFVGQEPAELPQGLGGSERRGAPTGNNLQLFLHWAFRGGFALIFIINGFIAWLRPEDFISLLQGFPLASMIGHLDKMVFFTGVHDVVLGLFILSGRWQPYVLAWAGVWLTLVTFIKFITLI